MKLGLILFFQVIALLYAKPTELTREKLLKKVKVPEKRVFPISRRSTPCQDFHHYACSEVENKFKLPLMREDWIFSFSDIDERLLYARKQFFNRIASYKAPDERSQQFKDMYLSCMDKEGSRASESRFVTLEKSKITKVKNTDELVGLSQNRIDQGLFSFSHFKKLTNKDNPLKNDILIRSGALTMPEKSYYENPTVAQNYRAVLVEFFKALYIDHPEQRADHVIKLETQYAQKIPTPAVLRDRYSQKKTLSRADFINRYPALKLSAFLDKVPEGVTLVDVEPEGNEFYNKLFLEAPLDEIKSLFLWYSLQPYMDDAYSDFHKKYFTFQREFLGGPQQRPDRQERCTQLTYSYFPMEIDHEMVDIMFPEFDYKKVAALAEEVRTALVQGLEKTPWLSRGTRKEAIKKIQSVKFYFVKPESEEDWNFLPVKKYSAKDLNANQILHAQALAEKDFKELSEVRRLSRWEHPPLLANAYYIVDANKFIFPVAVLQFPFYDESLSKIENMAGIGSLIGHEFGHAIDDQGSKYDSTGQLRHWFSSDDHDDFKEKTSKFISQFNKIGYDGELTLGENIGDLVGLTFAYKAAFPKPELASVEDKQKFFLAYAREWCSVRTPSLHQKKLKIDPHPAPMERINQQVIHQTGFYEAFSCQEEDRMYLSPKERISVW